MKGKKIIIENGSKRLVIRNPELAPLDELGLRQVHPNVYLNSEMTVAFVYGVPLAVSNITLIR